MIANSSISARVRRWTRLALSPTAISLKVRFSISFPAAGAVSVAISSFHQLRMRDYARNPENSCGCFYSGQGPPLYRLVISAHEMVQNAVKAGVDQVLQLFFRVQVH